MRQITVLPPPDNADLIRQTAVEKVVRFPNACDDDACADAYRFSIAAASHDDEIFVILDKRDLEGRTEAFGRRVEHGVGLQGPSRVADSGSCFGRAEGVTTT